MAVANGVECGNVLFELCINVSLEYQCYIYILNTIMKKVHYYFVEIDGIWAAARNE